MRSGSVELEQSLLDRAVGEALRAARRRVGFTQAGLALRSGLATEVYARIEQGRESPRIGTLLRICLALGIAAEALLPDVERSARARYEARHPARRARHRERSGRGSTPARAPEAPSRPSRDRDTGENPERSLMIILLVRESRE